MEDNVTSDDENRQGVDMNSGGDINAQPQATATGGHGFTSSEAEAMHNRNPSDHFQSVDETNLETPPSAGACYLKAMMEPKPQGERFFVDKSSISGVHDSQSQHFQMNPSAPAFHVASTTLDSELATQIHMTESLGTVNQTPSSLVADDESSRQDKITAARQTSAPAKLTTSKATFDAVIKENYDLADTALGTLQSKSREPADDDRSETK